MEEYILMIKREAIANKYLVWWENIIRKACARGKNRKAIVESIGYVEGHHIFPVSFGASKCGSDDNIVYLTAKEHIMVHRLMCFFTVGKQRIKSLRAFSCMRKKNGGKNPRNLSAHHLAKTREASAEAQRGKRGISGVPSWYKNSSSIDVFALELTKHVLDNKSDPSIGKIYGVSAQSIYSWRQKLGIPNRRENLRNAEYLRNQYIDNRVPMSQLANDLGCSYVAVSNYLRKFGIPIRNAHERQQLRRMNVKIPSSEIFAN